MTIKDSGERREFGTGAVRDIADGKGRCDLLPLAVVANVLSDYNMELIDSYITTGRIEDIVSAIKSFSLERYGSTYGALLEVSKQYEDGAKKYAERNWEQGIPCHCFVDSGVRHYLKFRRGDKDEPHDRAFLWNMYGLIWTHCNKPELIDLPFKEATNDKKPYENLANAIVEVAVDDYRRLLRGKTCVGVTCNTTIEKLEEFFLSEWFYTLTNVDGEIILNRLRREYENECKANATNK